MAYNRKNFLKRVIQMQDLVLKLQYQNGDLTYKEIYHHHVYPKFGISKRTFDTWLGIPAKAQLKQIENKKGEDSPPNQLKLF